MKCLIVNSKPYDEDIVYKTLKEFDITSTNFVDKADFVLAIGGDSAVLKTIDYKDNFVLAIGGDSAVLKTIDYKDNMIDIIPINTGTLGFLSNDDDLSDILEAYINDDVEIDYRYTNKVKIGDREYTFLNEVALLSPEQGKLLTIDLELDGEYLTTYKGDGLIISTSTGSTAWNLSAGGAIAHPSVECLMITPSNPFSMNHKPLIVDDHTKIKSKGLTTVVVDGINRGIHSNTYITEDNQPLRIVRLPDSASFFKRIQSKLGWGKTIKGE